jgi:LasA protease
MRRFLTCIFIAATILGAVGCVRPASSKDQFVLPTPRFAGSNPVQPSRTPFLKPTRAPGTPILTPTPDQPHILPTQRTEAEQYTVQANDTLGKIAQRYGVDIGSLTTANNLADPDHLEVGQVLTIPVTTPAVDGPDFKIIPDSELVYSPATVNFDLAGFIHKTHGYLNSHSGEIDSVTYDSVEIVARVAREYSVNPRLLLAILEYQSGWVTQNNIPDRKRAYPVGFENANYASLYRQLSWAANNLNRGFYLWQINAASTWLTSDGALIKISPSINAGTAGVEYFFSLLLDKSAWQQAVSPQGFYQTYNDLFGYPFDYTVEPLLPAGLAQPKFQLPFEEGQVWSFTGGPHAGWGDGSAWAALDFAPPGEAQGCVLSDAWVVAVTDGVIIRSGFGEVVEDLDGDGFEQTGWTVLYLHIDKHERVAAGTSVHAGDRIGHPSCEGGVSEGTHTHLARRYNGEWIAADGPIPFNLDGWISHGAGVEYDGTLRRDDQVVEAWDSRRAENQIQR